MKKSIIYSVIILLFSSSLFAGGPWPQKKGKGYFKLSEWWTVFDEHYTDNGLRDPNVTTGIFNTSFYGEYGLSDRFTVLVNVPLISRNYMNNLRSGTTREIIVAGESINTIGDLDLSFKYGLSKPDAKIPVALTLTLGIPTGTASAGTLENLQTGDGEFNQILRLDFGKGFQLGKIPAYISAHTGVNNRSNDFSEEFRYGLEFGIGFAKDKLWLTSKFNAIESFKNGATAATTTSTSLFANNSEFSSLGLEASYYITKSLGISAGFAGALRGEIIAAAPSYSVGVFYDMK